MLARKIKEFPISHPNFKYYVIFSPWIFYLSKHSNIPGAIVLLVPPNEVPESAQLSDIVDKVMT